ncbi:MAG: Mut7-C RNAse domain-containing protein [Candidatus Accumulibacter sp. UW26]|uniref:Mut7-C RNAse domain-containing protein n=1 Tax=Candidatus Accumulibacter contiguus TaxID=2954381 RepID=UPI00207BB05B|nr:Mut7-C RNAse domain-containing protein [Candidatus Accumulibacter contiguus]
MIPGNHLSTVSRGKSQRLDLVQRFSPFTLCLECNAPLLAIDKIQVIECLPPSVRANRQHFTFWVVFLKWIYKSLIY